MKYLALLLLAAGCVTQEPGVTGTQSLKVDLITPTNPGSPDMRLADTARDITFKVTALDEKAETDTSFNGTVDVYIQYLGTLTPDLSQAPFATVTLTSGVSSNQTITLPPVYGPTVLWIQDGSRADATYATGTSPQLWYRDPTISDISTPTDLTSPDALDQSPLENKQVAVDSTRYKPNGALMVTSVFAQGYTLSDVDCTTTPCTTGDFDAVTVFSFSAPQDDKGNPVREGEIVGGFAGAVEEFNGLTEIGFPQTFSLAGAPAPDPTKIPVPVPVQTSWWNTPIEFEKHESFLVEMDNATVCPLDSDYTQYNQWKLNVGNGCGQPINVITAGTINFDPSTVVGMTIPKVVGTLRPVNIGTFNVWIVYPRDAADLVLN